jgi:hypothetical protein
MNFTFNSLNNTKGTNPILPALPPVTYKTILIKELTIPHGLFDDKTVVSAAMPLDSLLPLIVAREKDTGTYTIVDGCKRFKRFVENNHETCACAVFDGVLDKKAIGFFRIFLNQKRSMSIRESVCFYKWLASNCGGSDNGSMMDYFGFNAAIRLELEPIATSADIVLNAIDEGRLSLRAAPDFCLLGSQDQAAFLDAFRGIDLSQQTQREFLEWLPEIAYSRKMTVSELLQSEDIQKKINDKILNNPQKIEAIRTLLHSWKFPLYDETLKKWKKIAATTSKDVIENEPSSKVVFVPSPAFEMNKLEIRITINHAPAAKEIFQKLLDVPQKTWSQLIYPVLRE